jgi:hypothetical protein
MPIIATRASAAYGAGFAAITAPPDLSGFYAVATYSIPASGTASTITFSSIPQNYTHLQIRATLRNSNANSYASISTGSGTVTQHYWYGTGTNPFVIGTSGGTDILASGRSDSPSLFYAPNIIDIEDYSSTTRNKVIRVTSGQQLSISTGFSYLSSLVTQNTNAITTVTISASTTFAQYSSATLYAYK